MGNDKGGDWIDRLLKGLGEGQGQGQGKESSPANDGKRAGLPGFENFGKYAAMAPVAVGIMIYITADGRAVTAQPVPIPGASYWGSLEALDNGFNDKQGIKTLKDLSEDEFIEHCRGLFKKAKATGDLWTL